MKKNIIYSAIFLLAVLAITGCSKKSAGLTNVVDYVVLKLEGESQVLLGLNEDYVEPGFTATDKGADVKANVEVVIVDMMGDVVDEVTTDSPGIFTIYYTATSEDGFTITESRQVLVYDPLLEASIAGEFVVDFEKSQRVDGSRDWTWQDWSDYYLNPDNWSYSDYSLKKITLTFTELVPGIYECDDLLGGFYTGLRGYGPLYKENYGASYYNYYSMGGLVLLNADLSIDLISSEIPSWGDGLDDFEGEYDDETGVIEIHSIYGGMDFNVVMVNSNKL